MAKKFVRGVTGIEDIESYDKTLTNVNDILSDGQDTYVHTKKGKNESYYKLTDSLKSVTSDNSDLITVTKDDTTNTATIHPKHDAQKEQSLESTRSTITIQKGSNGTNTTTKVDTNPQKVLEHGNLLTDYGISKNTSGNTTKLGVEYTRVDGQRFDLNNLIDGKIRGSDFINAPSTGWLFVSGWSEGSYGFQRAVKLVDGNNTSFVRRKDNGVWKEWREQVGDKSVIDALLAQKQNTLTSNASVGVIGNTLRQLYALRQTYTHANGLLKTSIKSVSENTMLDKANEEFNFTVKINQNAANIVVTLNEHDKTAFGKIMTAYGSNNTVRISGCVFTLSGSTLTVSTSNNTAQNYVISFSDILD